MHQTRKIFLNISQIELPNWILFLDNFNKAWHKRVKEKYSSTETNDEKQTKNKYKKLSMCSSSDESDDGNSFLIILNENLIFIGFSSI